MHVLQGIILQGIINYHLKCEFVEMVNPKSVIIVWKKFNYSN